MQLIAPMVDVDYPMASVHLYWLCPQGQMVDDYWAPGQQMLGDIKFLETLK